MSVLPKTDGDIMDMIAAAEDADPSKVQGMSYYEGVSAALRWVVGETDDPPVEEID